MLSPARSLLLLSLCLLLVHFSDPFTAVPPPHGGRPHSAAPLKSPHRLPPLGSSWFYGGAPQEGGEGECELVAVKIGA